MTVIASLDLGTNSTRVLVARPAEGRLEVLDRRKENLDARGEAVVRS